MPIGANANHGWAAKRRQAAAIFVSPAQCIKPRAVLRNAAAPDLGTIFIERDIFVCFRGGLDRGLADRVAALEQALAAVTSSGQIIRNGETLEHSWSPALSHQ
jgi:hypothetical protein